MTDNTGDSFPTYIYKILPSSAAPPDPIPERLPVSDLDTSSGFIHLSTAVQVPQTLKLFFANDSEIYLLRLVYANVRDSVKWENNAGGVKQPFDSMPSIDLNVTPLEDQGEPGGQGFFPHLYNGFTLGNSEIESTLLIKRQQGNNWEDTLGESDISSWLQY